MKTSLDLYLAELLNFKQDDPDLATFRIGYDWQEDGKQILFDYVGYW